MTSQVTISDDELAGFSEQASADFVASIESFKIDLLREIGRIEAGHHSGDGLPEITSRMVKDAETVFSRGVLYKKKRRTIAFLRLIAALSIFVAGILAQKDFLKEFDNILVFIAVAMIAIFSNTYVNLKE